MCLQVEDTKMVNNSMYWERAVTLLAIGDESESRYEDALRFVARTIKGGNDMDGEALRDWLIGREWRDHERESEVRAELAEYLKSR